MRWTWWHFAALVLIGVALTAISLLLDWPWGGFFLLLPLVFPPFRFGGSKAPATVKRCPSCDFATTESWIEHCPRDGTRLVASSS